MRLLVVASVLTWLVACSGSSEAPLTPPPIPHVPAQAGLGRVPDVPEVACAETRATAPLPADATITSCRVDADCTDGRNGRCLRLSNHGPFGPALEATTCSYDACFRDADCSSPSAACYCGARTPTDPGLGHTCAGGECARDEDCGAGRYCRRGPSGRVCHSPADLCTEETECGEGLACDRRPDGIYECLPYTSPLG